MDTFIEGLKLTVEGMGAAFVVCVLIMIISGLISKFFHGHHEEKQSGDDDIEQAAAISAAISFAMDNEPSVSEIPVGSGFQTDLWNRRTESDLPEGGEY